MLNKVNKLLINTINNICWNAIRNKSSQVLYPLQRGAVRVEGPDAADFLQGLITNDMNHFAEGARSIYAMFLNTKGRVIMDALIHKWREPNYFIIECDKDVVGTLHSHLSIYKLKRHVQLQKFSEFQAWAAITSENVLPKWPSSDEDSIKFFKDPRLDSLGIRVLSPLTKQDLPDIVSLLSPLGEISLLNDEDAFRTLRYSLGVGEGSKDFPPGTCFPLEINCDYLHGVSFHKGCYIGQEVTARIYHTGVVRKRLLPINFGKHVVGEMTAETAIKTKNNINIGKLKGYCGGWGLGLLRVKEAFNAKEVTVGFNNGAVHKPDWWPMEAPKEKVKPPTE